MDQINDSIKKLSLKLQLLMDKQVEFQTEIQLIQTELENLKKSQSIEPIPAEKSSVSIPEGNIKTVEMPIQKKAVDTSISINSTQKRAKKSRSNFESFIGENLINKIGIIILVIGVAIGTKYAIDNQLVGPTTRILLGYLVGLGLLGVAIKLKKKYAGFSAVLLSGAMAILFFITYAAYSFYSLIPQTFTFALLIFYTIATVVASISYNKQIIAHIGLVGAYSIPFLFSRGSNQIVFLFTYTFLINIGILTIALLRYWKLLSLSASSITWILYLTWYIGKYDPESQFAIALSFLILFFLLFFATIIIYKLRKSSQFRFLDVALLTGNSFIFYALGYSLLSNNAIGETLVGLFTLLTAILHFIVTYIVYRLKLADKNLFYLLSGMVLLFLTITFPVQLDGGWVTIFWAGEATILFWIGRTKNIKTYEYLAYPLMVLAFGSIIHDWTLGYNSANFIDSESRFMLFFNINFLTSLLLTGAFAFIFWIENKSPIPSNIHLMDGLRKTMKVVIPIFLVVTVYFAFRMEISYYWNLLFIDSEITITESDDYTFPLKNYDLYSFKTVWLINYTLLFMSILSVIYTYLKANRVFGWIIMATSGIVIIVYLSVGLYALSELRESFTEPEVSHHFNQESYLLTIRYISYIFVALSLIRIYQLFVYQGKKPEVGINLLISGTLLWILSSELLHWFDLMAIPHSYKIGLSIFWGIYSLLMVGFGIIKRKKHLRITALGILGFTLLKLLIYDLSHMTLLSRAIIFILLGIVMLGVSFLYNKYKNLILDEN